MSITQGWCLTFAEFVWRVLMNTKYAVLFPFHIKCVSSHSRFPFGSSWVFSSVLRLSPCCPAWDVTPQRPHAAFPYSQTDFHLRIQWTYGNHLQHQPYQLLLQTVVCTFIILFILYGSVLFTWVGFVKFHLLFLVVTFFYCWACYISLFKNVISKIFI